MTPMIQFDDVCLSFTSGPVFQNLSFMVEDGEHVCISAPSGKGKSSILNMIQGYVLPDRGHIWIDGLELNANNVKEIRSRLAFVPQNVNLPVKNGKELGSLIGEGIDVQMVKEYVNYLGLSSEMLERSFDKMSGGQKQRIVIAVCLSLSREVFLLDEPTASLDGEAIDLLIGLLKNQRGKTIISASHNREWLKTAERVITL